MKLFDTIFGAMTMFFGLYLIEIGLINLVLMGNIFAISLVLAIGTMLLVLGIDIVLVYGLEVGE